MESIKDLIVIINYFDKYPFKKKADFELWKQIFFILWLIKSILQNKYYLKLLR